MKLWKIALAWAAFSALWFFVIGFVPTRADGVSCGALFQEQPMSFFSSDGCTDQRSLLKIPAVVAAVSAVAGFVVAFWNWSTVPKPTAGEGAGAPSIS